MVRAFDLQSKGPEFEGAIYMYMYVTKFALFFFFEGKTFSHQLNSKINGPVSVRH